MRLSQIPVGILFEGMENVEEGQFGDALSSEMQRRGHSPDTIKQARGRAAKQAKSVVRFAKKTAPAEVSPKERASVIRQKALSPRLGKVAGREYSDHYDEVNKRKSVAADMNKVGSHAKTPSQAHKYSLSVARRNNL